MPSYKKQKTNKFQISISKSQTASAINHPNVCTIHEIREEGDQTFIVMEYVEGREILSWLDKYLGPVRN